MSNESVPKGVMKYNPKVERFGKAKNEMVRGQNKFLNE
jgi:hypothetical protein